jgi:hypothetical protein
MTAFHVVPTPFFGLELTEPCRRMATTRRLNGTPALHSTIARLRELA